MALRCLGSAQKHLDSLARFFRGLPWIRATESVSILSPATLVIEISNKKGQAHSVCPECYIIPFSFKLTYPLSLTIRWS